MGIPWILFSIILIQKIIEPKSQVFNLRIPFTLIEIIKKGNCLKTVDKVCYLTTDQVFYFVITDQAFYKIKDKHLIKVSLLNQFFILRRMILWLKKQILQISVFKTKFHICRCQKNQDQSS